MMSIRLKNVLLTFKTLRPLTFIKNNWVWAFFVLCTVVFVRLILYYNTSAFRDINTRLWSWQGFSQSQISSMSTLGTILYLEENVRYERSRSYTILVHKYGEFLERRHIRNFGDERKDPFSECSVRNCHLTYNDDELHKADAVLVHLHKTCRLSDLPQPKTPRPAYQRWVFLTDESPKNAFLCSKPLSSELDGVFNWSMSYRYDADVPVPYGRTVVREEPLTASEHDVYVENLLEQKTELAAILISNCGKSSLRWRYVTELAKHMPLAILGGCGNKTVCHGKLHYGIDCADLSRFKFYLAFENTLCDQYVTEKLWWNAFSKGAVPVVMGGDESGKTYSEFLPPGSYLSVDDFESPRHLAECLLGECSSRRRLLGLHAWRRFYEVLQEHAYFGSRSVHYCRLCEALNYNDETPKVYRKFADVIGTNRCRQNLRNPFR